MKTPLHHSRRQMTYRRLVLMGLIGYWVLLFWGTHLSPAQMKQTFPKSLLDGLPWDKLIHFWCFAVLGCLIGLVILSRVQGRPRQLHMCFRYIGIVGGGYGLVDELTQPIFDRFFDWLDVMMNVLGAWAAMLYTMLAILLLDRRTPKCSI